MKETHRTGGAKDRKGPRKVTAQYLENAALYYLGRYASSTTNLRRILMAKVGRSARAHGTDLNEGAGLVENLLERFQRSQLLDDKTYAEAKVISLHRRGTSLRAIRLGLAAKGVATDIIGQALDMLKQECAEPELTAAVAYARRRRFGPFRKERRTEKTGNSGDSTGYQNHFKKDLAAMSRAGFAYDIARHVIESDDAGELEKECNPQDTEPA